MKDLFGNGLWIFFGSTISNIISFVYIFLISKSVQPDVIGTLGAIMALQAAVGVFLSLGIPAGIQLFVGSARSDNETERIKATFFTSLIVLLGLNSAATFVLVILSLANVGLLGFSSSELMLIAAIHILSSISPIFLALFIALLESRTVAIAQIVSSVMKLPIGLIAVTMSQDVFSACSGIIASYLVLDLLLLHQWRRKLGRECGRSQIDSTYLRELLRAGRASWIPSVFTALGESVGVIMLYGIVGGLETGLYYIAFAISYIVYLLPSSILGMLFPLLSGMKSGREDAASKAIRLGMVVTVPVALCVFGYSEILLMILGSSYVSASTMLRVLVLGALLAPIVVGYNSYAYSERKYRTVVTLGLSTNVVRLLIYYPFVIIASGIGASVSYSLGILAGFLAVVYLARTSGFKLDWSIYGKILLPPVALTFLLVWFRVQVTLGIPLLLLFTLLTYGRMRVLTRRDLSELSELFLSPERVERLMIYVGPVVGFIFGD